MKKIIILTAMLFCLVIFAGGNNDCNPANPGKIEDIAKNLPGAERAKIDTILHNDRLINATLDVVQDLSKK